MRRRLLMTVDTVGGVWRYALDLAAGLVAHDIDTLLAVLGPSPSAEQRHEAAAVPGLALIDTGLPLDWLAEDAEAVMAAGRQVAALAAREQVDWVQLNQPALAAGATFAMAVVAVAHSCLPTWWDAVESGEPPSDFAWRARLHVQGLHAVRQVVCPSAAFAAATQRVCRLPVRPLAIHNGCAPPAPSPAAQADEALTAGRLWDRAKDVATLDRAAARLAVPVRAAGSTRGPHGESVSLRAVEAIGQVAPATLAGMLVARPVFVSTARYEPFGLAVLEAAAASCALVLSDIPTFRELWADSALFVAPGDDRGFAHAIEGLIADPARRTELGERARAAACRFTVDATADRMAALYAGLLPEVSEARAAA